MNDKRPKWASSWVSWWGLQTQNERQTLKRQTAILKRPLILNGKYPQKDG